MDRTTSGTNRAIVVLARLALLLVVCAGSNRGDCAEDSRWQTALASMPLPPPPALLNRDNVVCVVLFQSCRFSRVDDGGKH